MTKFFAVYSSLLWHLQVMLVFRDIAFVLLSVYTVTQHYGLILFAHHHKTVGQAPLSETLTVNNRE